MTNAKSTKSKMCYECYDDFLYAAVGFDGVAEAEEYYADLVEAKAYVKCPSCKREVDYGKER